MIFFCFLYSQPLFELPNMHLLYTNQGPYCKQQYITFWLSFYNFLSKVKDFTLLYVQINSTFMTSFDIIQTIRVSVLGKKHWNRKCHYEHVSILCGYEKLMIWSFFFLVKFCVLSFLLLPTTVVGWLLPTHWDSRRCFKSGESSQLLLLLIRGTNMNISAMPK